MAQAQIIYGPYPMTIAQMGEWAEQVTQLDTIECAVALRRLNATRITIRRAP
jgi:hypothetical protein